MLYPYFHYLVIYLKMFIIKIEELNYLASICFNKGIGAQLASLALKKELQIYQTDPNANKKLAEPILPEIYDISNF